MFNLILLSFDALLSLVRNHRNLLLEILVLHQQLPVLRRWHRRPSVNTFDMLSWVVARRVWSGWKRSLIIVTPLTVVRWHRASFRFNRRLISKWSPRIQLVARRASPARFSCSVSISRN